MASPSAREILLRLRTVRDLFSAPEVNPFSDEPHDMLGEPALMLLVRQQVARGRRWEGERIVIEVPATELAPGLDQRVSRAIQRYALARIDNNRVTISVARQRALVGLVAGVAVALLVMGAVYLLLSGPLAHTSETLQDLLKSLVVIFGWVALWAPLDRLLFDWVAPWRENRVLAGLQSAGVVVRAATVPEPERLA
jgi:hypothetical protein